MDPLLSPRREKQIVRTLAGIQFVHILDFMIMMPLGPLLMESFGIGTYAFGLLVASYTLSAAASGLLAATLIDRFERKRFLLWVFFLFLVATLACGLAPSYQALLIARGFAGTFGGVMGALVQTVVADVVPYVRRANASGVLSAAFSVATVAGVPLSLWLANHLQWRTPFLFIAALALVFLLLGLRLLPELRQHVREGSAHPFSAIAKVLQDANHVRALLYSSMIIFSGFTVIPYITLYAVNTVGIGQNDIPLVYLLGGSATLFSSPWIGRWADRAGKVMVYRRVALAALLPLLLVTHLGGVPLPVWLLCTTAFFVLISGRMIPAITIISSAAHPAWRGTFMSLNATVQSLSMGLATTLTGLLIARAPDGTIVGYAAVGWIAVTLNFVAIWFVGRIVIHDMEK
ncbi:MAG: MFS transporter [Magnetococcus sp. MYC-9]